MHLSKSIGLPPRYILVTMLCSFGGFLFGMDTGIIGPATVMESFTLKFGALSATIHGLVVSAILIPAAVSSFFAGRVADLLGRPKGIAIGSLIFGLGAALEGAAATLPMFVVGRCIEGIGEGLYLGIMIVYICEISPPRQRGALTTGPQLLITLGLVAGFFTCYGTANIKSSFAWRTPYIVLSTLSILFSIASAVFLVPSPRWLTLRGRKAEASAAWDTLGVGHAEREKAENEQSEEGRVMELYTTSEFTEPGNQHDRVMLTQDATVKHSFFDVFSREVRAPTALAVFMMAMQQLSGIDGVLYYAPLLFEQAGLSSSKASFFASGVSAIVIFGATIPGIIYADKWGRRQSVIFGGLGITLTMFLVGSLYGGNVVHGNHGAGRWVVIVSIYIFAIMYSITWGVGIKIYAAEIQPQRTRASATSLAHGSNWAANFVVAVTTPILLENSSYGAYFLFGACALLTVVVCAIFMPETKGRSLDDIEEAFRNKASGSRNLTNLVRKVFKTSPALDV